MLEFKIGNKKISNYGPIFFVAEIGINHNGDIETAKQLIDLATFCRCDAVKFQKRTPELSVSETMKNCVRDTPWGRITYLEYKRKTEFDKQAYTEIDRYCEKKEIPWFASPWDIPSVDFLEEFNVPCYKVPSAMLTDKKLLEKIRVTGKPVLLSTGMSILEEIDSAVNLLSNLPLVIMHCNSSYPADASELNLRAIPMLQNRYPNNVIGYSGHEKGYSPSLIAALMGARVIERHITLDRTMWGSDQAASLELDGLRRLVRDLAFLPAWLGDGEKKVYPSELPIREKLRILK